MTKGVILTDIESSTITPEDKEVIEHPAIFGILLFAKNYENPEQLRALTRQLHEIKPNLVISVDQEGGRVQRFREGFSDLKSMSEWGKLYNTQPEVALKGLQEQTKTMVTELQRYGVQVSLAPVLDVDYQKSEVIGERSFHQDPEIVSVLAQCVVETMHNCNMPVIGKHFPGHGWVVADSHLDLPIDDRPWEVIWNQDMLPYRKLLNSLDSIMPAHIIYTDVDDKPVGFSRKWIQEILREKMNYQGLIVTDDLSMAGAAGIGDYPDRANLALEAGCDILTLCNNREGLLQVIDNIGKYSHISTDKKVRKYISILC